MSNVQLVFELHCLQEHDYIRQEARAVFRQHRDLTAASEIEAKVGGSSSSSRDPG
jgi:hypothetical protein